MIKISKNMKYILVVIDIIVILFMIFMFIKWNANKQNTSNDISNNQIENKITKKEVDFNNYTLTITSDYTYEHDKDNKNGILLIRYSSSSWSAYIEQFKNSDADFMNKIEDLVLRLKDNGYNVSNAKKIQYKDKDIIMMDYDNDDDESDAIIAYATIDDEYKAEITLYYEQQKFDIDYLYKVLDVLATAKKNELADDISKKS